MCATQGGSVIDYVLGDPELSQEYIIRGITRNLDSAKARQLKAKVEVVQDDVLDRRSLETALNGVHTIFAMTTPTLGADGFDIEYNSGKRIADVAVEQGAQYVIFSTLPAVREIAGGKYTKVIYFDAKAKVEQYMRGLPTKSAFYCPGSFMENFHQSVLAPRRAPDGKGFITWHVSPQTKFPLLAVVDDSGKFVGSILAEPDKYEGKKFCAATALYILGSIAAIMSKVSRKTIVYKQISPEGFKESLSSIPFAGEIFTEGFNYYEEFGYFGPDTKGLVSWAAENARGSTLDL
ncbi:hypothetical protein LTR37_008875 [Vermiconidia calcicola]|uniref:Uncharacterized protein n=1 Tax=Vermiconidia calcicola TaxID=1690605 RepID=A0ACC3N9U3_9PEZI|nr:hypothetical protein LTR37_008875 [Vermiconidia calcicola]